MERCPICRARLREDPRCPRCGTDLTRLLSIETHAAMALRQALAHLAEGRKESAFRFVESSLRLKHEPLALALRDFLSDDQGEIPAADWFWRMDEDIPILPEHESSLRSSRTAIY